MDTAFGDGMSGSQGGAVWAVGVQADGRILVAGEFTQINGTPRDRVARLNAQDPFGHWAALLSPDARGPSDDPGDFGMPNLLRYAFGMDPLERDLRKLPRIASIMDSHNGGGQAFLTLTYVGRTDDSLIRYILEGSHDLIHWSPLTDFPLDVLEKHSTFQVRTVRDTEPLESRSRRFLRVRVIR
jgi:hypothetical protein